MPPFERLEWYTAGRPASYLESLTGLREGFDKLRRLTYEQGGEEGIAGLTEWLAATAHEYPLLQEAMKS
jgi:hypothetical protein